MLASVGFKTTFTHWTRTLTSINQNINNILSTSKRACMLSVERRNTNPWLKYQPGTTVSSLDNYLPTYCKGIFQDQNNRNILHARIKKDQSYDLYICYVTRIFICYDVYGMCEYPEILIYWRMSLSYGVHCLVVLLALLTICPISWPSLTQYLNCNGKIVLQKGCIFSNVLTRYTDRNDPDIDLV